jgi:indolepyruvate decarboxylase
MEDFIRGLAAQSWQRRVLDAWEHPVHPGPYAAADKPITVAALFRQINAFVRNDMMVIADPGDALFGAEDLYIQDGAHFLGPAYYCSLGFAVPAALGVKFAEPKLRPLVLVGDGAFQMSGMEIATIARYGQNPIVIVLDNDGYGTERPMLDGKFNDLHRWEYAKIPALLNAGLGLKVNTEIEMKAALTQALELAREVGNPFQIWRTLAAYSDARAAQGLDDGAAVLANEALVVVEAVATSLGDASLADTLRMSPPVVALRSRTGA